MNWLHSQYLLPLMTKIWRKLWERYISNPPKAHICLPLLWHHLGSLNGLFSMSTYITSSSSMIFQWRHCNYFLGKKTILADVIRGQPLNLMIERSGKIFMLQIFKIRIVLQGSKVRKFCNFQKLYWLPSQYLLTLMAKIWQKLWGRYISNPLEPHICLPLLWHQYSILQYTTSFLRRLLKLTKFYK